jgi:hypothetical protein
MIRMMHHRLQSLKKARFFIKASVLDICAEVNYCFFPLGTFFRRLEK